MTFVVDEEKRRTWNHGRLRKWGQGKFLFTLFIIGIASSVLMLPYHFQCFSEFFNIDSIPDGMAKNDVVARDSVDIIIVGVQVALIVCGVPVLGFCDAPEGSFRSETLVVEDGWLHWVRLSGYSPDGKSYSLVATACRLDECRLWVDEESGTLKIRAGRRGSMGWILCDTPAPALTLPLEEFGPAGLDPWPWEVELCPYYSPDLVQYLRDQGVEVAS